MENAVVAKDDTAFKNVCNIPQTWTILDRIPYAFKTPVDLHEKHDCLPF